MLTHYQTTNFRLFQTERVRRRQFQIWRKWKKVIQTGRKHCGKRRNCSLRAISPFPAVFQKACFPGVSEGVIVWEWVKFCLKLLSIWRNLTLSQTTILDLPKLRVFRRKFQIYDSEMKMAECSQNGSKTLWEKEKLLLTNNFSFSHSVFQRLLLQKLKIQGLFGKYIISKEHVKTKE